MLNRIKSLITKLFIKQVNVGLLPLPKDDRDFTLDKLGLWGLGEYTPKYQKLDIPTSSVKTQGWNTCSFNSSACAKEKDEQVALSPQCLVCLAQKEGLISSDGFANLRASETILLKYGCCEDRLLSNNLNQTWEEYSSINNITQEVLDNAALHKTKSYFFVRNHNEALQQLDNGHFVKLGVSWRTAMNMNGGFSIPWLLNFLMGSVVGGHAFFARGYDLNYQGKKVFKCQNSYGRNYGDNGCMYITFDDFDREVARYGATVNLDLDKDVARWFMANNGKVVKQPERKEIYLIENGKKRLFLKLDAFYSHGFLDEDIIIDMEAILPLIPDGENMNPWDGKVVKTIKALIQQRKELKPIFQEMFNELFI